MNRQPLLIIARHSSTKYNASSLGDQQRIRGWIDLPLTEKGHEESAELADKLEGEPIEEIFCSDLTRAIQTAKVIADRLNLPVIPTRKLRPWGLGYLQGQVVKDVKHEMDRLVRTPNERPRGPDSESFNQFKSRVLPFIQELAKKAHQDNKVILVVTHTRDLNLVRSFIAAGAHDNLSIDIPTFERYGKSEVGTGGYQEIMPHEVLGPEWKSVGQEQEGDTDHLE